MKRASVTPSLFAPDLPATVRFYVESLGFEQTGSYTNEKELETWAEVSLGDSRLWFFANSLEKQPGPAFSGMIYVFVEDVDAVAARLKGQVPFEWGPDVQDYGLRELGIRDIDGYYIVFARDIE